MPKIKRKRVGDIGIRLKPIETNLLENYNEFSNRRNKTRNKKKKKTKKPKRDITKSIEIYDKVDPLYKIMEDSRDKPKGEIEVKELSDVDLKELSDVDLKENKSDKPKGIENPKEIEKSEKEMVETDEPEVEPQFKKIRVHEGKPDLSEKDPNIKSLKITAPLEPDKKKKGHRIKLE